MVKSTAAIFFPMEDCFAYLHFVEVCLVSMPGVIKVDSVWTTFVKTPHPSLKNNKKFTCNLWRRAGLMVSALVSGSRGSGSSPGRETLCCVLGQDTLLSQYLSLPRCINEYR